MPDQQLLIVTGLEVEIRAWRGTDNTYLCKFQDADGNNQPLTNYDVTFTVTDKPGGTVKFTETKTPGLHSNAAEGETLFALPRTMFASLTGQRQYTWKYQVVWRERTVDTKQVRFYGDMRIYAPNATP